MKELLDEQVPQVLTCLHPTEKMKQQCPRTSKNISYLRQRCPIFTLLTRLFNSVHLYQPFQNIVLFMALLSLLLFCFYFFNYAFFEYFQIFKKYFIKCHALVPRRFLIFFYENSALLLLIHGTIHFFTKPGLTLLQLTNKPSYQTS